MPNRPVRLAVVQAAPIFMDAAATTEKAIALIREAAANGADLLAFPEVWIPGYPWWSWLGSPAWGAQFLPRLYANALPVDGADLGKLREAAAECQIHVVIGFIERDKASLFISQVLIDDQGCILMHRRKLKPTFVERTVFGEGDGSDLQVVDTRLGRIGALCCAEHVQPLSKFALYSQNEQIHVASWPAFTLYRDIAYGLTAEANLAVSQVHAIEGGCFVLHATAVNGQDVFDMLCDTDERVALLNSHGARPGGGCSAIFGPDGKPLTERLPEDAEGILYADADFDQIIAAKAIFDPAGHYCRADATQLLLHSAPREPVLASSRRTPPVPNVQDETSVGGG